MRKENTILEDAITSVLIFGQENKISDQEMFLHWVTYMHHTKREAFFFAGTSERHFDKEDRKTPLHTHIISYALDVIVDETLASLVYKLRSRLLCSY